MSDITSTINTGNILNSNADYQQHLKAEMLKMMEHASQRGIQLPTGLNLDADIDSKTLLEGYNELTKTIAPTTIQSIEFINAQILTANDDKKWFNMPVFTKCIFISIFALLLLIGMSLFPQVNEANQQKGLLASQGLILLYNLIFICSASLLGVMFYLLKTISDKIKSYTLLPIDAIEVNAIIIIGIISGFVISELFTFETPLLGTSIEMHKMTLALLGGFSSDAIFTVLQGIVQKAKMLVSTTN